VGVAAAQYVFGYGSLVAGAPMHPARLHGHRRVWGVAMDNSVDIPGYKSYRASLDGSRPAVFVAFLDIVEAADSTTGGSLIAVDDALLRALDARERNYDRIDVTQAIALPPPGRVWAYRGSEDGRARLRAGLAAGCAVVSRDYLANVVAGVAAIAPEDAEAVERSPRLAGLELLDLERVEIPLVAQTS
jgi:hypothetical protein